MAGPYAAQMSVDAPEDSLHWHALNYRTAATQHAEGMWQKLVAHVAHLEAAARAPKWLPIEGAPKDARLLLWGKFWNGRDTFKHPMIGGWHPNDERWVVFGEMSFGVRPTHYMPLPPGPDAAGAIGDASREEAR